MPGTCLQIIVEKGGITENLAFSYIKMFPGIFVRAKNFQILHPDFGSPASLFLHARCRKCPSIKTLNKDPIMDHGSLENFLMDNSQKKVLSWRVFGTHGRVTGNKTFFFLGLRGNLGTLHIQAFVQNVCDVLKALSSQFKCDSLYWINF